MENKKLLKKKYGDDNQLKVELFQTGKTFQVIVSSKINNMRRERKFFKFSKANNYFNKIYEEF